jgi:hypothetical protein
MEYIYYTHRVSDGKRIDVSTRFEDVSNNYCEPSEYYVDIHSNTPREGPSFIQRLSTLEDWQEWQNVLERNTAWKPSKVLGKNPLQVEQQENPFDQIDELPEKNNLYFVEDDGYHKLTDSEGDSRILTEMLETKQSLKNAIDPDHYQGFIETLQWIEAEFRKPQFRNNPEAVKGALIFQVDKYLGRNGRKDEELQEIEKALWYLKFLVAYIKIGCKPIYVAQVEDILSGELTLKESSFNEQVGS